MSRRIYINTVFRCHNFFLIHDQRFRMKNLKRKTEVCISEGTLFRGKPGQFGIIIKKGKKRSKVFTWNMKNTQSQIT